MLQWSMTKLNHSILSAWRTILHGKCCLPSFHPDLSNLTLDLLNFFLVSSTCVVWYHRFQFSNLLCICRKCDEEAKVLLEKVRERVKMKWPNIYITQEGKIIKIGSGSHLSCLVSLPLPSPGSCFCLPCWLTRLVTFELLLNSRMKQHTDFMRFPVNTWLPAKATNFDNFLVRIRNPAIRSFGSCGKQPMFHRFSWDLLWLPAVIGMFCFKKIIKAKLITTELIGLVFAMTCLLRTSELCVNMYTFCPH